MAVAARISRHFLASRPLQPHVTSSTTPEVHIAHCRRRRTDPRHKDLRTKFCADRSSSSRDMLADRQSHTHRQVDHNTMHPYRGGVTTGITTETNKVID